MTCPNCGQPVLPTDAYCQRCGQPLVQRASAGQIFSRVIAVIFLLMFALPAAAFVGLLGACFISPPSSVYGGSGSGSGSLMIGLALILLAVLIVIGALAYLIKTFKK